MVVEEARLEIGDDAHAGCVKLAHERLWVGVFIAVPSEDVTPAFDRGVTGAKMERADWDFLDGAFRDERFHLLLCVGAVGDRHRRLCKAKTPARRQSGAACQVKEFSGYVSNAGTGEDVIVEIAVQRFIAAVGTVVVVVLATEIECRGRHVVIEGPLATPVAPSRVIKKGQCL